MAYTRLNCIVRGKLHCRVQARAKAKGGGGGARGIKERKRGAQAAKQQIIIYLISSKYL